MLALEEVYLENDKNLVSEFEALPENTYLFNVLAHEEFHSYQGSWSGIKNDQMKFYEEYLKNPEARVLRVHLMKALNAAVMDYENVDSPLEAAKYWSDRYDSEYEAESKLAKSSDIIEGSARYFDMAMNVTSSLGLNATKEERLTLYQRLLTSDYDIDVRYDGYGDSESYDLGGLSGILLEMEGRDGWQKRVEKGESPVDILLENVEPVEQVMDEKVREFVLGRVSK